MKIKKNSTKKIYIYVQVVAVIIPKANSDGVFNAEPKLPFTIKKEEKQKMILPHAKAWGIKA